jgi:tRNA-dihydrouridine synthase B
LFGKDPQDFAKALQDSRLDKFDIIDINMGCPVNKVIKHGEGSGLMATPDVACDIVRTCVRHSNGRPVTVKHRLGIECGDNVAVEFGLRLQDAGASALAIHGRYQQQLYRGDNDWDSIGRVAQVVDIPVIGSGNIVDRQGYDTVMRDYPISAVMIGRAAIGNPRVFETILGNNIQQQPVDIMQLCRQHLQLHMQYNSAPNNIAIFKKHLSSYIARLKPHIEQLNCNVSHINDLKQQAHRLASEQQVYDLIDSVV